MRAADFNIPYIGKSIRLSAGPDVMDRINRNSDVDLSADDVAVFEDFAANDQRMNRTLRLTSDALDRFAKHGRDGRKVVLNHDDEKPIGHTFDGHVEDLTVREQSGQWLVLRWYAVKKGASEKRLQRIRDVETGVVRYSSVGTKGGVWTRTTKQLENEEVVSFAEIRSEQSPADDGLQLRELSRIAIGAVDHSEQSPGLVLSNGQLLAVRPPAVTVYSRSSDKEKASASGDPYGFAD